MTFRRSFMDNYKNRLWVVAAVVLTALLQYGFIPALYLGGERMKIQTYGTQEKSLSIAMQIAAGQWLSFSQVFGMLLVLFLAVVIGIQGFSYLYRTSSVDFYDSQPVSYRQRFLRILGTGMLLFTCVYALGVLLGILVLALTGAGSGTLYLALAGEYIWFVVLFAGMYSFVTLAAVLSGNVFMAFLLSCFLSGIECLFRLLFMSGMSEYFTTNYITDIITPATPRLLPLTYFTDYTASVFENSLSGTAGFSEAAVDAFPASLSGAAISLVITCVATALAYIAFVRRPREMVGKGLCFPFMESLVKLSLGICGGILAGLVADGICESVFRYSVITFVVIAITVALVCMIGEWVFSLNVTKILHRGWQIPVCFAVSALVIVVFKQDMFGYDSYIPDAALVESAALYPQDAYNYSMITRGEDGAPYPEDREEYLESHLKLTDVASVEKLAAIGMKEQRHFYGRDDIDYENQRHWSAIVLYRMTNGRMVWRKLAIPYDIDRKLMDAVIGSDEYVNSYFDIDDTMTALQTALGQKVKGRLTVSYSNLLGTETEQFTEDILKKLQKAYRQDRKNYDYSYLQEHICIGTLDLNYTYIGTASYMPDLYESYPVYEGYDRTIAVLQEYGLYHEARPDPEQVEMLLLRHIKSVDEIDEEDPSISEAKRYDAPDQIAAILEQTEIRSYGDWSIYVNEDSYITVMILSPKDIELAGLSEDPDYYEEHGYGDTLILHEADFPDFVKADFGI